MTVAVVAVPVANAFARVSVRSSGITVSEETSPSAEPTASVEPTTPVQPNTAWMDRYRGRKISRIRTSRRLVALTFDDGPNALTRPTVDVLERFGAKGTFFATWWCSRRNAASNRYVLLRGHELANHTTRHKPLTGSYAFDMAEIRGIEKMLIEQTGRSTIWVRAMGGGVNATGLHATKDSGHLYAQWSIDSLDSHARYTAPHRIYHNVVDHVRPGDVILLHVTHRESLAALPAICKELKRRGYKMVTLSELAAIGRP